MDTSEIMELIEDRVAEAGLLLVDMTVKNLGRSYALRVLVDRPGRVTVSECAHLSRTVMDMIEEKLLLGDENYRLEISSPGIGRQLSTRTDWIRCVGRKLSVKLNDGTEITDWLEGYQDDVLRFRDKGEVPSEDVMQALEVI